jgi:hypothetical protein
VDRGRSVEVASDQRFIRHGIERKTQAVTANAHLSQHGFARLQIGVLVVFDTNG